MIFKYRSQLRNLFCSCFIFFLVYLMSCNSHNEDSDDKKQYSSLNDTVQYAGILSCKECHSDKYETFLHTGMGLSFDRATKSKSSAKFSDIAIISDTFKNLQYHPFWKNDSLVVLEFRLSGRDTLFKRAEHVDWIVGSGQHTNSHLMNVNGYVFQVPATFYTQKKKWDLPPGFEGGYNSRFSRKIGLECMTCHNAYPKMVQGSENKYSFVANGIDCERCHGPGSLHIREKKEGKIIDVKEEIDYSIVNPAKLPIDLQLDVCQRCHIQGNAILKEGKSFLDFKPGMHLKEVMDVYMPLYKGDDDSHIMASHAERLKMSKCFQESLRKAEEINAKQSSLRPYQNALTCITCHDPHVSVTVTRSSYFNSKCISCHQPANAQSGKSKIHQLPCKESMEVRALSNDNCISCHMPKGGATDIPHVITSDHYIRIPKTQAEVKRIKDFAGLICINNSTPDNRSKGEAFLSYFEKFSDNPSFLDSAKKYFVDNNVDSILRNFHSLVHWAFLKNDYKKVVSYAESKNHNLENLDKKSLMNEHAWTSYRIGESYAALGNNSKAVSYFENSTELAPFVTDFRNKLAGAQFDAGMIAEAKRNYEFILRENPKYSSAYVSLGFLLLSAEKNVQSALKMYDKALSLDPDNVQAFLNKAGAMLFLGREKDAKMYLKEVLKRDKSNEQAKRILSQLS